MKKTNMILATVAMTTMMALTGCSSEVSTQTAPEAAVENLIVKEQAEKVENVEVDNSEVYVREADAPEVYIREENTPAAGAAYILEDTADETSELITEETAVDWASTLDTEKDWNFIMLENEELAYSFELVTDESDYKTYGTLMCKGNNGTSWEYRTGKYDLEQYDNIELLHATSECLYLNEDGTIVAVDVKDGHVIWKNAEYKGCGSISEMDENGNLYVSGYDMPSLIVIDANGNTVIYVEQFADYYGASEMTIDAGQLIIRFDSKEGAQVNMNICDFSYEIL